MTKRKLGRGLQALLGSEETYAPATIAEAGTIDEPGETRQVPIADVTPNPYQPRRAFDADEIAALAESIRIHGLIQPIVVRRVDGESTAFQLIAGERRFRAAQLVGLEEIEVRIVEVDDQQIFEMALVENLQREDLNAIEKAQAFQAYIGQFGTTHEELAAHLGIDRSTVTNFMRLLELPESVLQTVREGRISNGHARALLSLGDPVEQMSLCRRIVEEGLSVRQTEDAVRGSRPKSAATQEPKSKPEKSNHLMSLENDLRRTLGVKVEISPKAKDKGTINIHFASHDDFERIIEFLSGRSSAN